MPDRPRSYETFDHDAYARTRARDDYWGQVRRTVRGTPVSDEQIGLIVDAIKTALALQASDVVLDLACGNGALSSRLFDSCASLLGVDASEFLISIAKEQFESAPRFRFERGDAVAYLHTEADPQRFSKALCYGSFSYFAAPAGREALELLRRRFSHVQSVFIGNLPDRERVSAFYTDGMPMAEELADHQSAIGIWRTRDEFARLADDAGWDSQIRVMPTGFWAAHYRYDVLLTRGTPRVA